DLDVSRTARRELLSKVNRRRDDSAADQEIVHAHLRAELRSGRGGVVQPEPEVVYAAGRAGSVLELALIRKRGGLCKRGGSDCSEEKRAEQSCNSHGEAPVQPENCGSKSKGDGTTADTHHERVLNQTHRLPRSRDDERE